MEQYREQYREETAQVHAPTDLIERTKAAMRVEEERLIRERMAQSGMHQPKMTEPKVTYEDYAKYGRKSSLRKWTYPLTAAAALLILLSVSLTMRGLKSENMAAPAADTSYSGSAESGAAYEESADLDLGFAESVAEATVETAEEEADMAPAAEAPAAEAPAADMAPSVNELQKAMSATADMAENAASDAEESIAAKEEEKQNQEINRVDSLADMAAGKNGITMEKVEKKPAFCDLPDVKTYVYEEETFIVRKEKAGWAAYVETGNGAGYLFRGEMEDVEEFLEAVRQSLAEL